MPTALPSTEYETLAAPFQMEAVNCNAPDDLCVVLDVALEFCAMVTHAAEGARDQI